MLLVIDFRAYQAEWLAQILSLKDLIVVKVYFVYPIVSAGAVHLSDYVLAKLNKSWRISCLNSSNKGIHFFVNLDIVLSKLGFETFFADATAEVISDCFRYLLLVCVDARVINNHSFLWSTSMVITVQRIDGRGH